MGLNKGNLAGKVEILVSFAQRESCYSGPTKVQPIGLSQASPRLQNAYLFQWETLARKERERNCEKKSAKRRPQTERTPLGAPQRPRQGAATNSIKLGHLTINNNLGRQIQAREGASFVGCIVWAHLGPARCPLLWLLLLLLEK